MQNLLLLSPTSPRRFPPSLRRSESGRRREQATGTPRTRGGPRSGAASSGCVGRSSAGTPWSKRSAETGHNTCRTDGCTNVGWYTEAMEAKQLRIFLTWVTLARRCCRECASSSWRCRSHPWWLTLGLQRRGFKTATSLGEGGGLRLHTKRHLIVYI